MKTSETWQILPCPIHSGKHRFHESRWIVTSGTELELREDGFEAVNGVMICQMRDVDPAVAHLISAAPDLLRALRALVHPMASEQDLDAASEAIAKAEGKQ